MMTKKGAIELTAREVLILILVVIIAAIVIGISAAKLGVIQKLLNVLLGQGNILASAS